MSNDRYHRALSRLIEIFKKDFFDISRSQYTDERGGLTHPGEFGASRENICKKLLDNIISGSRDIETRGFIINANNDTSTEQDLIIYSNIHTPLLTIDNDKFFPVETVVAIGQVKSVIHTKNELKEALVALSNIKKMRENMGHDSVVFRSGPAVWGPDGYHKDNPYDQISTFLICEKMNFSISPEEVDALYVQETSQHLKHNLICDLTNGIFGYKEQPQEPLVGIPVISTGNIQPSFLPNANGENHIIHLLANLQILTTAATVFHADMAVYLKK